MLLPLLLFPLIAQSRPHAVVRCSNIVDAKTEPLRSASGYVVVLLAHTEDDHGKNTHLCESDYSFAVTRPDGTTSVEQAFSADDTWDRRIEFGLDGFTRDGRVLGLTNEAGRYLTLLVLVYDLRSGRSYSLDTPNLFLRNLGRACAATAHIVGTGPGDSVVVETTAGGGCLRTERWRLRPGRTVDGHERPTMPARCAKGEKFDALDPGTATQAGTPH